MKATALVPHVPAALGGEVEELRRELGLDTNGLAGGINVGGSERGSGEVAVLAADGVGGGNTGGDETGEDGEGAGDGRHFERCGVWWWFLVGRLVIRWEWMR